MSENSLRSVSDNDETNSVREGVRDGDVMGEIWECIWSARDRDSNVFMRSGILWINSSRTSSPMLHHISYNRDINFFRMISDDPWSNAVSGYRRWSSSLRCAQNYSIGFISGELGGKSIMENPCSSASCWEEILYFFGSVRPSIILLNVTYSQLAIVGRSWQELAIVGGWQ